MFALAAAMSRHAPALLGPANFPRVVARLPLAGWALILLSLALTLCMPDWSRALVTWFGLLPLTAGAVLLGLSFTARFARSGVVVAIGLILLGVAAALTGTSTTG
jgi:hypothetical protein